MCGFAVLVGLGGSVVEPTALDRMSSVIAHRGPDAAAEYVCDWVGFGFRRLSILDLSPSGDQPMVSLDGQVAIVFNGEIYNYLELRAELEQYGHRFRSSGDTEVLLNAYRQWGTDCLTRLNGMWAFTILDRRREVLFGSRDRFGEKPLYCYRHRARVLLASEIKSILASGYYHGDVHWPSVARLLLQNNLDTSTETFFRDIRAIAPGSAFEVTKSGGWREWNYWQIDEHAGVSDEEDVPEKFRELFESAVRLRMRSDVPVGVCLSGGLDSTSIICAMAEARSYCDATSQPLKAFCYQSPDFDETSFIADTLAQTHAELNVLHIDERRLWELLPRVLSFHDEPLHSATALVGFELMQLAADNGVKVILNGQGADETLAGYGRYFTTYWQALAAAGKLSAAHRQIRAYTHGRGGDASRLLLHSVRTGAQARIKRMFRLTDTAPKNRWICQDFHRTYAEFGRRLSRVDSLNSSLKRSVVVKPLPLYLRIEDRNSMAHSVEVRLPFLDPRMVSFAFALSPNWKLNGPWNKFVLRQAMRGRIPESVRTRVDKMGFPTSSERWFREAWYEPMRDLLATPSFRDRGIFNAAVIQRDLERHRCGDLAVSDGLFHAAQLEFWFRQTASWATRRADSVNESASRLAMHAASVSTPLTQSVPRVTMRVGRGTDALR